MKTFVLENWYKLMVGSSMMMVSFGFMMYAISPAYSTNNNPQLEKLSIQTTDTPTLTNGAVVGEFVHFVDGGNLYTWRKSDLGKSYPNKAWSKTSVE